MARRADYVVVGSGVMGCAAAEALSRRGSVILLERVAPGHPGGSSHGESRIIRISNFENPGYAPWIERSVQGWRELEAFDEELYVRTGVLEAGPPDGELMRGTLAAAAHAKVEVAALSPAEVAARFPAVSLPESWRASFQSAGGYLRADLAIRRFRDRAKAHPRVDCLDIGATEIREQAGSASVVLDDGGIIEAGAVIVATGPWIADLIPALRERTTLKLTRQVLAWFAAERPELVTRDKLPVFCFDAPGTGFVYGFPDFMGLGLKAGFHDHGATLARPEDAAPVDLARDVGPIRRALQPFVGPLAETPRGATTCIYTNTRDEEFIVDRDPDRRHVVFASACSGHGFKFAPAIGELLADLADGKPPPAMFALDRRELAPETLSPETAQPTQ
jgi:sarcosine oxidase